MSKSAVYLIPCENYNTETVYQSLKTGLELMGGITACISPEESVLLKPNLLKGADPEKNITTHPAVLEAVIRCLQDEQFKNVKCGDGCGIGSGKTSKAMEAAGMKSVLDKYGIELCEFDEGVTVNFPEGSAAKKFNLCKEVTEADALISICKMKTHALETISGALKNQYGCLTMKDKGVGHAKYPDAVSFANMVADLNACIKPRLYIMDGIVAMEGNGPASGDPRQMNLLLISTDPVAMDTVFSRLIYLKPELVPTTVSGARAGLGTMSESEISVITPDGELTASEAAEKYGCPEFVVSRKKHRFWKVGELLGIKKVKRDRPVLIPDLCTGCGKCHEACPADEKAVQSGNGQKAVFDYSKCIRCYCCQELCPFKAIEKRIGR